MMSSRLEQITRAHMVNVTLLKAMLATSDAFLSFLIVYIQVLNQIRFPHQSALNIHLASLLYRQRRKSCESTSIGR